VTTTEDFLRSITVEDLDDDPYAIYGRLRREAPVAYVAAVDTWFVTRYADVQAVAEQPASFPATHGESPVELTFGKPAIIAVDGEVHHELRRSFDGKFRPRTVEGYIDDLVRPIAERAVGALRGRNEAELMEDYFEPISVTSLAVVLGLGDLGPDVLRRWFKGMSVGATNFERDPGKQAVADGICAEIDAVVVPRMEQLATEPDDSTMAGLLHAGREPGCPRDIDFVLPSLKVAILGGMQEPGHGAGSILAGLFTRPEQLVEVVADRAGLLPAAVDEGLRWVAPIGTQLRRAAEDTELGGTTVPAGASVSAVLASANRDEDVFADPDVFDLHRYADQRTREQAAFGFGKHFCSGHAFSRHQIRIALDVLLETFPGITGDPDQPPVFRGWEFRAPQHMHVRL
jgi:aromatic O-demethylase, cytochrome P450 subunit